MCSGRSEKDVPLHINGDDFSDEFLVEIFLRLEKKTLMNCLQSTRRFHNLISKNSFWIEYARIHGLFKVLPSLEWRNAAVNKNFSRNKDESLDLSNFNFNIKRMVLTGCGFSPIILDMQSSFRIFSGEGFRYSHEYSNRKYSVHNPRSVQMETRGGIGCQAHPDVSICYAFSFRKSTIHFYVDFVDLGIDGWVLDHVRPKIRISQKVNHRHDCGAVLSCAARLNQFKTDWMHEPEERNDNIFKSIKKVWNQWTYNDWEDWVIEFENYPSGMRHLIVQYEGRDGQFWAGFFGPKIANMKVEVILPEEPIIKCLEGNGDN